MKEKSRSPTVEVGRFRGGACKNNLKLRSVASRSAQKETKKCIEIRMDVK